MNPTHGSEVSVVLPCLNEQDAVGDCVRHALKVLHGADIDGCVVVVDNGSTDRSVEVARDAGAIVIYQSQPGYGAALRTGFEYTESTYCVMADADGTYEFDALPRLLAPVMNGDADLVLGSRLSSATSESMPFLHRFVGTPAISYLVNRATHGRLEIRDSQSGFRAFRRDKMLSLPLTSTGMEFASEMIIRSAWAGFRVAEVETTYAERVGESKLDTWSDGMRHLRKIVQLDPEGACVLTGRLSGGGALVGWLGAWIVPVTSTATDLLRNSFEGVASLLTLVAVASFSLAKFMRFRAQQEGHLHPSIGATLKGSSGRMLRRGLSMVASGLGAFVAVLTNSIAHVAPLPSLVTTVTSSLAATTIISGSLMSAIALMGPLVGEVSLAALPRPVVPSHESPVTSAAAF